ncbi:arf-GAP domain and FG repeat-containing protein 1-like isoform X1 [Lytechinus variegatus]|uniref:arf-GAP domain and FG repeat-containing protein 1-like isoform X1 n=1 Tax=Lytechinus variegatus TaxID=7654 RepID=UPI001BB1C537|nr:arf-GAP domain and FG repeat-containing protein 1-like isoform X1 [Lytechinus variegatus]
MASKRKQDDKHLKQLREMVSKEHNKTCFECNQRGPTYVDMTIGTFVCTSCSGILRGINPPHRVKSISMASYTAAEMTFLEKNGNEVCRHIWLGLYDSKSQPGPESKEDTKVRDYLVQKYEKKRWYVEPGQAAVLAAAKAKEVAESAERKSTSSSHSTPEPKPLKSLIGSNAAPIKVSQPPGHSTSTHNISKPPTLAQTANKQKSVDLLADLGGDPFASASQPAAQTGGFGQAPFGQATQQSPFGQPAQQAGFGQQTPFGQQAAFGQPAQQGGFADFSQAFGGQPQSSQAFPENNPKKESFETSGGSGDLADLFLSPQTTQQNDPFMPAAQPAAGSAPSSNNFGAFESAFTPQSAPVPVASSAAPLNPTVQGLQGLSIANASPPSGGAAASASSGGDKYAAFALMDSNATSSASTTVNWSGGSSSSGGINWGGGGGGSAVPKSSSSSGIDWGTGMAKSSPQAFPGTGSASATSLGTTSTSSGQLFGSASFGAQGVPQGNPFMAISSGATPATSTMANNPFLAGGAQGAPAQANGLFGMQPAGAPGMPTQNPMMVAGAGGAFNQQTPTPGANMQMNGRVGAGFPQGQFPAAGGFGGMPQGAMSNQFGMGMPVSQPQQQPQQTPQGGMSFGGAGMAAMAGLQFNKMGQPQQPMGQFGAPQQPTPQGQQQMTAWGAAPNAVPQQNPMAPNPFLSLGGGGFGGQAAIPPKSSNASNPFL